MAKIAKFVMICAMWKDDTLYSNLNMSTFDQCLQTKFAIQTHEQLFYITKQLSLVSQFFSMWVFFHEHSRHLGISQVNTAELISACSQQPDLNRELLVSEPKSLTLIYAPTYNPLIILLCFFAGSKKNLSQPAFTCSKLTIETLE